MIFSKKTWRFKLDTDFEYQSELLNGIEFENKFIKISNGIILIRKEYAWDGCSPAYKLNLGSLLPQGLWFGTWDGPCNTNGLPVSWRASIVHDAICQFRADILISKKTSVNIFKELLIKDLAPKWMYTIYPLFVSMFGPQKWNK